MTRVLMFPDGNFLAHVSRLLEIARVLRRDFRCDVRFAGAAKFMALVRDAGFEVEPCFTVPRDETLALASRATVVDPLWWYRTVTRSIRSDLVAIARHRPDVVVGDMHWSLRAASLECGVPYVSVVNAAWTDYSAHPLAALDGHPLTDLAGPRLAGRLMPGLRRLLLWHWAWPYQIWSVRHGLRGPWATTLASVMEGDLTLFPDIPELAPATPLPPTARYVGPILWDAAIDAPPWLDRLESQPRVYVSAGSTGTRRFFETAVGALRESPYRVVMSTGEIDPPGALPANCRAARYLPGLAVMRQAAVCVCHGGNGTVYQALSCGVPLVAVPSHVDQQLQAQLCERAGVGVRVPERRLTPETLRAAIDRVLGEPAHRTRAEHLRDAIGRHEGPRAAAAAIQGFAVNARGASRSAPAAAAAVV